MIGEVSTVVELLRERAQHHADRRALVFLPDGEKEGDSATFGSLDARARSIAAGLQSRRLSGERVLLLYPSGVDFVAAFFGCLYAGAIAVPAPLPRPNRSALRLGGVVADATPALVLTTAPVLSRLAPTIGQTGLDTLPWTTIDEIANAPSDEWHETALSDETIAFLQYTSGSTAQPRGVVVTHGNLLSNLRMIERALGLTAESTSVSWLPSFHDMGLVGGVLQQIHGGATSLLMPPEAFLMKPTRWLRAVSRYRARVTGGPNFAYDVCVQRVTPEQRADLDLSTWELAFVGAEPVRAATLKRFTDTFEPCGFRRQAWYPCYGLAEATVFVSGGVHATGQKTVEFSSKALNENRAEPTTAGAADARALVSCGSAWLDEQIVIVDPNTAIPCAPGHVGEIWVSGPNVARGYWGRTDETAWTRGTHVPGGSGRVYLRTGDLGFFHDGGVFIAGRLKDLIIVRGRNHHPVDIEHTVEECHPAIRKNACAAFSVESGTEEQVVVIAEVDRSHGTPEGKTIEQVIFEAVAEQHELLVHAVVRLKPSSIPRTSSGKIQRHVCRTKFLAGQLDVWTPVTNHE